MNGQLQTQMATWWRLITSGETLGTYQKALDLTLAILKETAKLLWLTLCLGLVAFTSFWNGSIWLGRSVRVWVDHVEDPKSSNLLPEAGRTAVALGKTAGLLALWQAREQLGLPQTKARPSLDKTLAAMPRTLKPSPTASASTEAVTPPEPVAPDPTAENSTEETLAEENPEHTPEPDPSASEASTEAANESEA